MHDFSHRLRALALTRVKAEAPAAKIDGTVATFRLYDVIDSWGGEWGISAKELAAAIDDLPDTVEEIHLQINSPGGEVFEALAIVNSLRAAKARVVARVDGIAASAASLIAASADELVMARNSELMIHDAWGLCVGNAADMRDLAEQLDRVSDNLASVYAEKAGGEVAEWRAAMARETWYTAQEAVDAGLADRVDTAKDAGAAKARFDLSIFNYAGRDEAPDPTGDPEPTPDPSPDPTPDPEVEEDPAPSEDATDATPAADEATGAAAAADTGELSLLAQSLERLAAL